MAKFKVILEVDIEDRSHLDDLIYDHLPYAEDDYDCEIKILDIEDENS